MMRKGIKICLSLILIIGVIGIFILGYVYIKLDQIHVEEEIEPATPRSQEIPKELTKGLEGAIKGISHILLIGQDTREDDVTTHSDAVMLVTLDTIHNNIKLTSFSRDAYVNIPEYGYEKLTHAYAYGQAPLLLDTVNKNFGLNVSDYISVDFESFIKAIDIIGGVEVTLEEISLKEFNRVALENYNKFYESQEVAYEPINDYGVYMLNGYQTLAYVRMRKADSTFAREQRQREIVGELFKQLSALPFTKYPQLFEEILPYVTTNIEPTRLVSLGMTALSLGIDTMKQMEFPGEDYGNGVRIEDKGWVLEWDEEEGRRALQQFLNE